MTPVADGREFWQWLWTAALTAMGALFKWNLKQLGEHIDQKADKLEVKNVHDALDELRRDRKQSDERSEAMHAENRQRLDRIYEQLVRGSR